MPSSTSNSDTGFEDRSPEKAAVQGVPDAGTGRIEWARVGKRVFFTLLIMTVLWEGYWRWRGFIPTHKDDIHLWADERERLQTAGPDAIAVIGSSRIFYGLESDMVRERTGRPLIQLAVNGMSPLPVLEDLAQDESFTGVVLAGISLQTLFGHEKYAEKADGWMRAYRRLTPPDRLNHRIVMQLEKLFVYPSKEELLLQIFMTFQILTQDEPHVIFNEYPSQMSIFDEKRGSYMTDYVEHTKTVRNAIIAMQFRDLGKPQPVSDEVKNAVIERLAQAVGKIQARGGKVVFIQYPSGGGIAEMEAKHWPRETYWEPLAAFPGVVAVHYSDHGGLSGFIPVEDSHLSRPDRIKFTAALMDILNEADVFEK